MVTTYEEKIERLESIFSSLDTSRRRREALERSLRAQLLAFEATLEALETPIAVLVYDRDLRFVSTHGVSRAWALPGGGVELIGKTLREALPGDADELEPHYRVALAGQVEEFCYVFRGEGWACRAAPLVVDGEVFGGVLTFRREAP